MVGKRSLGFLRAQYLGKGTTEIRYSMDGQEMVITGDENVRSIWQPAEGYVRTEGGCFPDLVLVVIAALGFPGEAVVH